MPGAIVFPGSRPALARKKGETHEEQATSFGVVYVNDIAREAMTAAQPAVLPRGSIIVREKLSKPDDAQPQLLAVMIKRASGFNSKAADWEFLVLDGAATEVKKRQKTGECQQCHASQQDTDFVFRRYAQ